MSTASDQGAAAKALAEQIRQRLEAIQRAAAAAEAARQAQQQGGRS